MQLMPYLLFYALLTETQAEWEIECAAGVSAQQTPSRVRARQTCVDLNTVIKAAAAHYVPCQYSQ